MLDPSKGYLEENVQWVHRVLNICKMSLTNDEFFRWCNLVSEVYNAK